MDKYDILETLGEGAFGVVLKARNKLTAEFVAIKQIKDSDDVDASDTDAHSGQAMSAAMSAAMSEVRLLAQFEHINITHYYECIVEDRCLNIVMEYAKCGDLAGAIAKRATDKKPFSEDEIMFWFVQIVLALFHVHSKNILHRDLKSQNVFVAEGNILKLGDFGIARVLNSDTELVRTVIGTPYYLSPEICEDKAYNRKSDVWALGCVLYELCTLRKAFDGQSLPALVVKILTGKYPPVPTRYSGPLRSLVDSMLQQDPGRRPSVDAILRGEFVRAHVERYAMHVMSLPGNDLTRGALGLGAGKAKPGGTAAVRRSKAGKVRASASRPGTEPCSAESAPSTPAESRRGTTSPTHSARVSSAPAAAAAATLTSSPSPRTPDGREVTRSSPSSGTSAGRRASPALKDADNTVISSKAALVEPSSSPNQSPSVSRPSAAPTASAAGGAAALRSSSAKVHLLEIKQKRDAELEANKNAVLQERARQKAAVVKRSQEMASALRSRAAQRQSEMEKDLEEEKAAVVRKARKAHSLALELNRRAEQQRIALESMRSMEAELREKVKAVKPTISKAELAQRGAEFAARAQQPPPGALANQVVFVEVDVPGRSSPALPLLGGFPPSTRRRPVSASSNGGTSTPRSDRASSPARTSTSPTPSTQQHRGSIISDFTAVSTSSHQHRTSGSHQRAGTTASNGGAAATLQQQQQRPGSLQARPSAISDGSISASPNRDAAAAAASGGKPQRASVSGDIGILTSQHRASGTGERDSRNGKGTDVTAGDTNLRRRASESSPSRSRGDGRQRPQAVGGSTPAGAPASGSGKKPAAPDAPRRSTTDNRPVAAAAAAEPPPWKRKGAHSSPGFQPQFQIFTPFGSSVEDPPPPAVSPSPAAKKAVPTAASPTQPAARQPSPPAAAPATASAGANPVRSAAPKAAAAAATAQQQQQRTTSASRPQQPNASHPPPPPPPSLLAVPPPRPSASRQSAASRETSFGDGGEDDDDDGVSGRSSGDGGDTDPAWLQLGNTDLIEVLSQIQDVLSVHSTPSHAADDKPRARASPTATGFPAAATSSTASAAGKTRSAKSTPAAAAAGTATSSVTKPGSSAAPRRDSSTSTARSDALTLPPEIASEADVPPARGRDGGPAGGVGRTASAAGPAARVAELRQELERQLGQERFAEAYKHLRKKLAADSDASGNSRDGVLEKILGPHVHVLRKVNRLIILEDSS